RKDGTTVGSISTLNGMLAIGNDNVFLNIDGGSGDYIYPMSSASGGASDGVVTLGFNLRRFKDLHLSGVAYASQIQATNTAGSNGTTTAQYGVIAQASSGAQATIGSHHNGDGYANLNLSSTVSGVRNMWHISKRLSSVNHRLEFFYYDANGFNSKFQMGTSGSFLAVDQISSNKGVHGTSVNNVDDALVVRAGSGDTAASRGRFSNNAADVAIGRNIATFPGTWTKADNSVASAGWVFGSTGASAFYQSNAGDTTPLANNRLLIDASGNVMAGTSSTSLYNNTTGGGIALMASNRLDVARVGDVVATFNRMSSDGSILQFYVRGVRCGDIHAIGTNGMAFAAPSSSGAALIVAGAANIVYPGQNNNGTVAVANNAIDLGASAVRFKDIFIGGDINHLDNGGNARVLYSRTSNLLGNGGTNLNGYQVKAD
ncbi:MAG: hypothetical protein VXW99_01780, partial [Pseudomonadota bacterium]|nr:hypothetical protein [Pseudomonadota bacterium]